MPFDITTVAVRTHTGTVLSYRMKPLEMSNKVKFEEKSIYCLTGYSVKISRLISSFRHTSLTFVSILRMYSFESNS